MSNAELKFNFKDYMCCKSCVHHKDYVKCKHSDTCLAIHNIAKMRSFVHQKYPYIIRLFGYYKYPNWEPINDTKDYILTDEDFRL